MITLTFNTTLKSVSVTEKGTILASYLNVPTVKVKEEGYYEVLKQTNSEEQSRVPVARFPIQNTIMFIEQ